VKLSTQEIAILKTLKGKLADRKNDLGHEAWEKNGSSPIPKSERREGILEAMRMIDEMMGDS
jgi:hypothetical protein